MDLREPRKQAGRDVALAERLIVYVDGFNLYHGLHDAARCRWLWLDLVALAQLRVPRLRAGLDDELVDGGRGLMARCLYIARDQAVVADTCVVCGQPVHDDEGEYRHPQHTRCSESVTDAWRDGWRAAVEARRG